MNPEKGLINMEKHAPAFERRSPSFKTAGCTRVLWLQRSIAVSTMTHCLREKRNSQIHRVPRKSIAKSLCSSLFLCRLACVSGCGHRCLVQMFVAIAQVRGSCNIPSSAFPQIPGSTTPMQNYLCKQTSSESRLKTRLAEVHLCHSETCCRDLQAKFTARSATSKLTSCQYHVLCGTPKVEAFHCRSLRVTYKKTECWAKHKSVRCIKLPEFAARKG